MNCSKCNIEIFYKGRGRFPKYCKKCRLIFIKKNSIRWREKNTEKESKRVLKYYYKNLDKCRRYRRWYMNKYRYLGTTPFNEHMKSNFDEEYDDIQKEKKRLKLK